MGRHYDKDGHFTDWWDNATVAAFEKKARCFVEQYSNFTKPNRDGSPRHVNGLLTLGENIADAGGVTASFQAWKRRDGERPDPLLPGLQHSFTKEQLFFVSYANWWCGKTRPETVVNRLLTDPHSPFDVRVVVSFRLGMWDELRGSLTWIRVRWPIRESLGRALIVLRRSRRASCGKGLGFFADFEPGDAVDCLRRSIDCKDLLYILKV